MGIQKRSHHRKWPFAATLRGRLFLLMSAIFVPLLAIQALIYYDRFQDNQSHEYATNLEVARTRAKALEGYFAAIAHQELAIGVSFTSPLPEDCRKRLLEEFSAEREEVEEVGWVAPDGRVLASSNPQTIGKEIADRSYLKEIESGKQWVVSPLLVSKISGEPIFTVSRGFRDREGILLGVAVAVVDPERLGPLLKMGSDGGEQIRLIDGNGMIVFRDPHPITGWEGRKYPFSEKASAGVDRGFFEALLASNVQTHITASAPISTTGWRTEFSRPRQVALKPIVNDLVFHGSLFLSVTAAVFLIAFFMSRGMAGHITKLQQHALALERGDLERRADPEGPLELQDLACGLNAMATAILSRQIEIKKERRRAEKLAAELAKERAFLDEVIKQMPAGVVIAESPTGRLILGSRQVDEIWRLSFTASAEMDRYKACKGFHHDGSPYRLREWPLSRSIKFGETVIDEEVDIVRGDCSKGTVSVSSSPVYDACRNLIAGVMTLRDVTQRKNMEQELRRSRDELEIRVRERTAELEKINLALKNEIEEKERAQKILHEQKELLESIFTNVHFLVAYMDTDFKFVRVNRAYAQADGRSPEFFIGKDHFSLFPNDENRAIFKKVIKTGVPFMAYEKPFVYPEKAVMGTTYWDWSLHPIKDPSGEVKGLVLSLVNVTERRRAQDELKTYVQEIESKNRELQEFAYVASHDLQEPLRKIQAFSEILSSRYRGVLDDEGIDFLERMQSGASRMQNLINALLEYSRISTRRRAFSPTDLNQVAQEVLSNLEVRLDEKGGRVEIDKLPAIDADRVQMLQLFQNLIGNALKFGDEDRPPLVRIYARELFEAQALKGHRIYVEDNGIGFDEENLDRIFVPFERLHGRGKYEGTGIGLAICRKIVERHGGTITARSAKGRGSTFIVEFPQSRQGLVDQ